MTETTLQRFARLQMIAVQKVANEVFLECVDDLWDGDLREELIAQGRAGCRSGVIELAAEIGISAEDAIEIAANVEVAFEAHLSKLLLSQMRGEA